jgi:hypothetical protein
MTDVISLVAREYRRRLAAAGIPRRPDRRTPEQETTAALEFWAARSEVLLDAGSLDRSEVEQG